MTPESDLVWNRACDTFDIDPGMPPGDAALAAVLLCHGMAMNGGLLHAWFHALVPDDGTVFRAFEAHLRDHPEAYAPV
ncbi:MAG: hypothetical protein ACLGI3_06510 [Actinomycetes bacterium]